MADCQERPTAFRGADDRVGLGQRARHRLLDEHRRAGFEERDRNLVMQLGRNRKRHGVDAAEHIAVIVRGRGAARGRCRRGAIAIDVDDGGQVHIRQRGENPGVMPPEMPDPNNRYAHPITSFIEPPARQCRSLRHPRL